MKLKALLSGKFKQGHLSFNEKKYFKILDQYIGDMFPKQDSINVNLTKLIVNGPAKHVENMGSMMPYLLPLHIRDNDWMVDYIDVCSQFFQADLLADKKSKKDVCKIPHDVIAKYITMSPKFEHQRAAYEQNVIKGCIVYNQIEDEKLRSLNNIMYEDFFRSKVVYTALQLGIDRDAIEACLELNANMWRKKAMYIAFSNEVKLMHENVLNEEQRDFLHQNDLTTWEGLVAQELKYMQLWVRKREHEYYRRHKTVIDKLGTATPAMQMDVMDAHILYLDVKHEAKKYDGALLAAGERIQEIQDAQTIDDHTM